MDFNPDALLTMPPLVTRQSYGPRDVILYALGVGVGIPDPLDPTALRFLYERQLEVLPAMAIVLAAPPFWVDDPAFGITWQKLLNAGQTMVLHAPLPTQGNVTTELRIDQLYDKGPDKGALMLSSRVLRDDSGTALATIHQQHILRGDGGFGGTDAPPSPEQFLPDRPADCVIDLPTRPEQALIYRLSGDYNPLHIDPAVAHGAGFDKPILHGSCTFGIACRAVLAGLAESRPERIRQFGARFSRPVLPGDTIRTEMWVDGDAVQFRASALERGVVVLASGSATVALRA